MTRKNLYAFTSPGASYPSSISVNAVDGKVEISIREEPVLLTNGAVCGETIKIDLTEEQAYELGCKLVETLSPS